MSIILHRSQRDNEAFILLWTPVMASSRILYGDSQRICIWVEADVLIVSGDLTTNGEKDTHLWRWLRILRSSSTWARKCSSSQAITISITLMPLGLTQVDSGAQHGNREILREIYEDFGYDQAYSRDPASLSYVVRLTEDTFLLMLDTNKYEDNQALGYPDVRRCP